MFSPAKNFYAAWRMHGSVARVLHDEVAIPTERLLQTIWQHQRLQSDQLQTTDGRPVRIFHPGFISVEGGPDFGNAVLQIGDDPPQSGDVEIDLRSSGWHAHGHDRNPHFQNVVLHVVWKDEVTPKARPANLANRPITLVLHGFLDAPLTELNLSLENEPPRSLPESQRGKCCSPLRELDDAQLIELLREAARLRFETKAGLFRARARHVGWEQALWEQLFRALGYKHNAWPMQHLAALRPRWSQGAPSVFELQARLLGISGLLPQELTHAQKSTDNYLRRVWDCWWRERDRFAGCQLPRAAWKFHGLRPANHPQRRLALAAHWLADETFVTEIENWGVRDSFAGSAALPRAQADQQANPTVMVNSLREILEGEPDEFWSWHWTFRSARMKQAQPLLGNARVTDLAINVILPWLWIRAVEGKNEKIRVAMEQRYFGWPAAEDNSVLKLARQRLLGMGKSRVLRTAAVQQGLLQIVRDFCDHSNAVCEKCRFPELVRGWNSGAVI